MLRCLFSFFFIFSFFWMKAHSLSKEEKILDNPVEFWDRHLSININYCGSIVEGDLLDIAYVTHVTFSTSFVILELIFSKVSYRTLYPICSHCINRFNNSNCHNMSINPFIPPICQLLCHRQPWRKLATLYHIGYLLLEHLLQFYLLLRAILIFSLFTSPNILTASPGPGKGCLVNNSWGTSRSLATFLTSSLYKSLKGSN